MPHQDFHPTTQEPKNLFGFDVSPVTFQQGQFSGLNRLGRGLPFQACDNEPGHVFVVCFTGRLECRFGCQNGELAKQPTHRIYQDHSKRASNKSNYLLARLVVCGRCGKHFVGNAATGRRERYTYYTCFSRQRYGTRGCSMDRLPAEDLEREVFDALVATYQDTDLIEEAILETRRRAESLLPKQRDELAAVEKEIHKTEESIDRYLSAFEEKTLPEPQCGARVRALGEKLGELQARRQELTYSLESRPDVYEPSSKEINVWRSRMVQIRDGGTPSQQKAMFQSLIHDILVEGRDAIFPTFRLEDPNTASGEGEAVRAVSRSVQPAGVEPARFDIVVTGDPMEMASSKRGVSLSMAEIELEFIGEPLILSVTAIVPAEELEGQIASIWRR